MNFDALAVRLEKKVYNSCKGRIRLTLLEKDLCDTVPSFTEEKELKILDAGGGSGRFSRICAARGHKIHLCDLSQTMLGLAEEENIRTGFQNRIDLIHQDLETLTPGEQGLYDLVLLHGAAEWTGNPSGTIRSMMEMTAPGGYLSLLVFNKDKMLLKQGINGQLVRRKKHPEKKRKLTPPGALSSGEIRKILQEGPPGEILLQSGIRIFQGFFLQWKPPEMDCSQWVEQESLHYRTDPFSSLGEHTHFIWHRKS